MDVYFDRKGVVDLLTCKTNNIGKGSFGYVKQYDEDTLIKVYKNDIELIEPKYIPAVFDRLKSIEDYYVKNYPNSYETKEERLKSIKNRLSTTMFCNDLIEGLAYYRNYSFGILLKYYKDYSIITRKKYKGLSREEREILLSNIEMVIDDLMSNYIYPLDVKRNNIMFNDSLEVKLIDLDDSYTHYKEKNDEEKREICKKRLRELKEGLENENYK